MIKLVLKIFRKFADENFVVCFLVVKELTKDENLKYTAKYNSSYITFEKGLLDSEYQYLIVYIRKLHFLN